MYTDDFNQIQDVYLGGGRVIDGGLAAHREREELGGLARGRLADMMQSQVDGYAASYYDKKDSIAAFKQELVNAIMEEELDAHARMGIRVDPRLEKSLLGESLPALRRRAGR